MTEEAGRRVWPGRAEYVCWLLAAVLVFPQLAAVAAREVGPAAAGADWSASRQAAYQRLLQQGGLPSAIGRLRLPARDPIPIFSGTGEAALTLGAGHLPETAGLAEDGNIAIAGHRDGHFRALRHLQPGDRLVLENGAGVRTFRITETRVVAPEDVWVLDGTPEPYLTLITCHPFYFVGSAPDRYVVRARLESARPSDAAGKVAIVNR